MSDTGKPQIGSIVWMDLTVQDAEPIRDFYCQVTGWKSNTHDMGEYSAFDIALPENEEIVAGICHARGSNAKIPPQWMIYITVANVADSAQRCVELGGSVVDGPRKMGDQNFCIIKDPAGAVAALVGA